jgi:hypothetical protein
MKQGARPAATRPAQKRRPDPLLKALYLPSKQWQGEDGGRPESVEMDRAIYACRAAVVYIDTTTITYSPGRRSRCPD